MTGRWTRTATALLAGLTLVTAAGCATAVTGTAAVAGAAAGNGATSNGQLQPGAEVDPQEFYDKLKRGNTDVRSALGNLEVKAGPVDLSATFSQKLNGGKVEAIDMNMTIKQSGQNVNVRVLVVDGKVYIGNKQLLEQIGAGDKKWALASEDSANATLSKFAKDMAGTLDSAGTDNYAELAGAAKSVKFEADERRQSVSAHRYLVTIDVEKAAKLGGSAGTSGQQLKSAGITELPMTMWLDDQGRMVEATYTMKLMGQDLRTTMALNSYNTGVTIDVPDPDDVYQG